MLYSGIGIPISGLPNGDVIRGSVRVAELQLNRIRGVAKKAILAVGFIFNCRWASTQVQQPH